MEQKPSIFVTFCCSEFILEIGNLEGLRFLFFKVASRFQTNTIRKALAQLSFWLIAILMLIAIVWFAFFSNISDVPLHTQSDLPTQMLMSTRVSILAPDGHPAVNAIVTIDNNQQVLTDGQGIASFEDLMFHDHKLQVVYNGQHYLQHLHIHNWQTSIQLNLSQETQNLGVSVFAILLIVWFVWGISFRLKRKSVNINQIFRLRRLNYTRFGRSPLGFSFSFFLIAPLLLGSLTFNTSLASADAGLSVPTGLNVEQDDKNAILTWNGGPGLDNGADPANVTGYKVSWGLSGQPLANVQITQYRILQLQPLVNGQSYQATVQSMDTLGNLSAPSSPIAFTGSSARVDALKARMTAFFDDFNNSAGAVNELKWNNAYSICNNPNYNFFFINAQFHTHNLVDTSNCDRGQNVSRPRQTFDFGGRTGTIAFDFDGEFRRDQWYLDLVPNLMDIGGQVNIEAGTSAANPGNVLRFHQNGQMVEILYIDATGFEHQLGVTNWQPYKPLDWAGLTLVPNVRRHWELHISQTRAEITVNGQSVLVVSLQLPFTKATLLWNEFSYNTSKSNEPFVLAHWDNFGFDGPGSAIETHNYRTVGYGGFDYAEFNNSSVSRTILIPDVISGSSAQRLMFTLQMQHSQYSYNANDKVTVNGQTFAMPKPGGVISDLNTLVSAINPYSEIMNLPAGVLQTGVNNIEFSCASCGITNVHTELDFVAGQAPVYTSPDKVNSTTVVPTLPDVGPGAAIESLDGRELQMNSTVNEAPAQRVFPVGRTTAIHLVAQNEIAMDGTGKNPGISKVELWLDKVPIWSQNTGNTPRFDMVYNLDTTSFSDGQHALFFVAYDASGTPSIPDYFQGHTVSGDYYPIQVKIDKTVLEYTSNYSYNLPLLANTANTTLGKTTTFITLQNMSNDSIANVSVQYYGINDGSNLNLHDIIQLPPKGQKAILPAIGSGYSVGGIVASDQPLNLVVSEALNFGGSAYNVSGSSASTLYSPIALNGQYGFGTSIIVFNAGTSNNTTGKLFFYDEQGNQIPGATKSFSLNAHSSATINQTDSMSGLNADHSYWAKIVADDSNSNLSAQVIEFGPNNFVATFNAIVPSQLKNTLYAPATFKGQFGFASGMALANPNSSQANLTINYYDAAGNLLLSKPANIPAQGVLGVYQPAINELPGTVSSSTVISDQPIIMTINERGPGGISGTYIGLSNGSNSISIPVVAKGFAGFTTGITVLNTSSTESADLTFTYQDANGNQVGTTQNRIIGPNASFLVYQGGADQGLPNGFFGTALINSDQPLLVTTNALNTNSGLFYTYTEPSN